MWRQVAAAMAALLMAMPIQAGLQEDIDEAVDEMPVARAIRNIVFPGQSAGGGGGGNFGGGGGCQCTPMVVCSAPLHVIRQTCNLPDGSQAVCCPAEFLTTKSQASGQGDNRIFGAARINVRVGNLNSNGVNAACQKGIEAIKHTDNLERNLVSNNVVLKSGTPAAGHLRQFKTSTRAKRMAHNAQAIVEASTNMLRDFQLTAQQGGFGLKNVPVAGTLLGQMCPPMPSCSNLNLRYRTIDGSCNNPNNPAWGMSTTPNQRILPPTYSDGVWEPRTRGADGSPLPNVRHISNNVMVDLDLPDTQFTSSVMQWAQFVDHDVAHVPFPSMNGKGIECCHNGQEITGNMRHPKCWPINTGGDRLYSSFGSSCMNFVRSMLAVNPGRDCTFGYGEQLNQVTHWLDGSQVYGSTAEEERDLRTFSNGLLQFSPKNYLPILPKNQGGECEARERGAMCYSAGDSRVNEQPGLTAIHTLWMREHNRVARELHSFNPQWTDELLFQEARRIVVAELQHITFNEWLPIIVGRNFMDSFGIKVLNNGYSFDYNANLNPNMNNEFSTAAFRFGHSLVQGTLRLFSEVGGVSTIQLRHHFNSPHIIQNEGKLDEIVRSFTQLAIQKFDSFVTKDLSNHLFQTPATQFGMDLMSLNIHRGRDHGIATYNSIREICGLRRARNFDDLRDQMDTKSIDILKNLYRSVDDVDFFVGGMSEKPVSGGLLGWTFLCVVGDQFARLKKGDRYFYDLGGQPGSFSEVQLQEIRKSSWARVICDNTDTIRAVQPLAFQLPNNGFNQPSSCRSGSIPRMNLRAWQQ
ncbi:hypothetical protein O3P69_008672 [Scylla paramamosain]|uniref:Peroxinectin n=1 Tax=Scylla paramamosain TaxID=85552 RepID=A0AAW0SLS0_SCYPA